jgi:Caspase domain
MSLIMARLNALVIGNADYQHGTKLKNSTNDAEDLSKVLEDGGFRVTTLKNANFKDMKRALKAFCEDANDDGDISVFFFAGHGVEVEGVNYLIAVDTEADDQADVEAGALSLSEVINRMEPKDGRMRTNIIILDACRDNPFERNWRGKPRGLAPVYAPRGTLVAFATSPGQFASDGAGRNGAYTSALLKHIEEPDLPVEAMFKRVRNTLGAATAQKQISWEHTSLAGEFYFNTSVAASIDNYSVAAIKDKLFALDPAKKSHGIIRKLKSSNWPTQNAAVDVLIAENLNKTSADNLFVLGRNILQAAHGSAHSALGFIVRFREKTAGMAATKRKALLDGILFEIFFDPNGEIRKRPKLNMFNEVFELEQFEEFKDSFDFIAAALARQARRLFAVPGRNTTVTADVKIAKGNAVTGVFVGGVDYLKADGEDFGLGDGPKVFYRKLNVEEFHDELAQLMLVPKRLLKLVLSKEVGPNDEIKWPMDAKILIP